jgi:hypothetical protein
LPDGDSITPPESDAAIADAGQNCSIGYDELGALMRRMQALGCADGPTGATH